MERLAVLGELVSIGKQLAATRDAQATPHMRRYYTAPVKAAQDAFAAIRAGKPIEPALASLRWSVNGEHGQRIAAMLATVRDAETQRATNIRAA